MAKKKRDYKRDKTGKFATTGDAVAGKKVTKKKKVLVKKGYSETVLHPGQTSVSGMTVTKKRKRGFYKDLQAELRRQRKKKR